MKIIEQSSNERDMEVKTIFYEMKPLLEAGETYSKAFIEVTGRTLNTRLFKDVVEYGESQGYPKIRKWDMMRDSLGIRDVTLIKSKKNASGKRWDYNYSDGNKRKVLCSYDLRKLEKRVTGLGLPWIVVDSTKAEESYALNDELLQIKESKMRTSSGVKYVSRHKSDKSKKGYRWAYVRKKQNVHISSSNLKKLRERITDKGYDWIVIDEVKYNKLIDMDA